MIKIIKCLKIQSKILLLIFLFLLCSRLKQQNFIPQSSDGLSYELYHLKKIENANVIYDESVVNSDYILFSSYDAASGGEKDTRSGKHQIQYTCSSIVDGVVNPLTQTTKSNISEIPQTSTGVSGFNLSFSGTNYLAKTSIQVPKVNSNSSDTLNVKLKTIIITDSSPITITPVLWYDSTFSVIESGSPTTISNNEPYILITSLSVTKSTISIDGNANDLTSAASIESLFYGFKLSSGSIFISKSSILLSSNNKTIPLLVNNNENICLPGYSETSAGSGTCILAAFGTSASLDGSTSYCNSNTNDYYTINKAQCLIEYVDLNTLDSNNYTNGMSFTVKPPTNNEFTIDFWYYIVDPSSMTNPLNIRLEKLINIYLYDNSSDSTSNSIEAVCMPLETVYPSYFNLSSPGSFSDFITSQSNFSIKLISATSITTWKYIRCAFSLRKASIYIEHDDLVLVENDSYKNKRFTNDENLSSSLKRHSRYNFRKNETTKLSILSGINNGTSTYIKHINLIDMYVPNNLKYKYYNISELNYIDIPLLSSIPFELDASNVLTVYSDGVSFSTETVTFDTNKSLTPSINFKRLNILPLNKIYDTSLLDTTSDIFPYYTNVKYVYLDNTNAIICNNASSNMFWLSDNTCSTQCDSNKFRNIISEFSSNNYNSYCIETCTNVSNCPETTDASTSLSDSSNGLICSANFINNENICYSNSDFDQMNFGLHYSQELNSPKIKFSLPNTEDFFTIDFWIYPDYTTAAMVTNGLTDSQIKAYYNSKYILSSDAFGLKFNSDSSALELINLADSENKTHTNSGGFNPSWSHVIISINNTNAIATTKNKENSLTYTSPFSLSFIEFNQDTYENSGLTWGSFYYSYLRIGINKNFRSAIEMDYTITSSWYLYKFDVLSFNNNTIDHNGDSTLFDNSPITIEIDPLNLYNLYDNMPIVEISVGYAYEDTKDINNNFNTGLNISSVSSDNLNNLVTVDNASLFTCDSVCSRCYGTTSSDCFSCNNNYYYADSKCISYTEVSNTQTIFGKQVLHLPYNKVYSLEFKTDSLTLTSSSTMFAFIKFFMIPNPSSEQCIISFIADDSFCLKLKTNGDLTLVDGATTIANILSSDISNYIDKWIPISLSTQINNGTTTFPKGMISFSFNNVFVPLDNTFASSFQDSTSLIQEVKVITGAFSGYISHVTTIEGFVINPLGLVKKHLASIDLTQKEQLINDFGGSGLKARIYYLRNHGSSNNDCVDLSLFSTDLTGSPLNCVNDYNPYIDISDIGSSSVEQLYVDSNYITQFASDTNCCISSTKCIRPQCHIGNTAIATIEYIYETCSNKNEANRYITIDTSNSETKLICNNLDYVAINNYNNITTNALTPNQNGSRIEFTFMSIPYDTTDDTIVLSFYIDWQNQVKAEISKATGDVEFVAKCSFIGTSTTIITAQIDLVNYKNSNINIICAVDYTIKKKYIKVLDREYEQLDTNLEDFNNTDSTVVFADSSTSNYGFSLLKNVKICNSYSLTGSCLLEYSGKTDKLNLIEDNNANNNLALNTKSGVALFAFTFPSPQNATYKCLSIDSYNYDIEDPALDGTCYSMLNLNLVGPTTGEKGIIEFTGIPQAKEIGRYSLGLWIFIEEVDKLATDGINISYTEHIHIHIAKQDNTTAKAYCIPMPYLLDKSTIMDNLKTSDITTTFTDNSHYIESTLIGGNNSWTFVYCAVSEPQGIFHLNNSNDSHFTPNIQYESVNNPSSLPMAKIFNRNYIVDTTVESTLSITYYRYSTSTNSTKFFIKDILVFKDYIPKELYSNFFFFKSFNDTTFGIIFYTDLTNKNYYTITPGTPDTIDINYDVVSTLSDTSFVGSTSIQVNGTSGYSYSSSNLSINLLSLCAANSEKEGTESTNSYNELHKKLCLLIGGSCDNSSLFCAYFDSNNNSYPLYNCTGNEKLQTSSMTCITASPTQKFIEGSLYDYIDLSKYAAGGTCDTNTHSQFYFDCISNDKYPSIQFNGELGFYKTAFDMSTNLTDNYTIEIWFYALPISTPNVTEFYYLDLFPHIVYRDTGTSTMKYIHNTDSAVDFNLDLTLNEWNSIVISSDSINSSITAYFNYDDSNKITINTTLQNIGNLNFCNLDATDCATINWGNAIYKIRVWKEAYGLIDIMRYSDSINNKVEYYEYFFDFSLSNLTYVNGSNENKYQVNNYDNTLISMDLLPHVSGTRAYNIAIEYDTILKNNKTGFVLTSFDNLTYKACSSNCDRCYLDLSNNTKCYKCQSGYSLLLDLTCEPTTKYFKNSNADVVLNNTDLSNLKKYTISFYTKIIGTREVIASTTLSKMIVINSTKKAFITFDNSTEGAEKIEFYINDKLVYSYTADVNNSIFVVDEWIYIGLSVYIDLSQDSSPSMFNMQINKSIVDMDSTTKTEFDSDNTLLNYSFTDLILSKQTNSFYGDLRIYSTFMRGPIGLVYSKANRYNYLFSYFQLALPAASGDVLSNNNTLTNITENNYPNDCLNSAETSTAVVIDCLFDEIPNLLLTDCNSGIGNKTPIECEQETANSGCVNSNSESFPVITHYDAATTDGSVCSCYINKFNHVLLDDNTCGLETFINFNYIDTVSTDVLGSQNKEMTLEFWVYIYSYDETKVNTIDFFWDRHLAIKLAVDTNNNNNIDATCYPFVDASSTGGYFYNDDSSESSKVTFDQFTWVFIRCSVAYWDAKKVYYIDKDISASATEKEITPPKDYTDIFVDTPLNYTFSIKKSLPTPYINNGLLFIQHISLYSAYLHKTFNTSRSSQTNSLAFLRLKLELTSDTLPKDNSNKYYYTDIETDTTTFNITGLNSVSISVKTNKLNSIGGASVISTTDFFSSPTICNNTNFYNTTTDTCEANEIGTSCSTQFDKLDASSDNCIQCSDDASSNPQYIYENDNKCYAACPDIATTNTIGYGGDAYTGFCRPCHSNCIDCVGPAPDQCLDCKVETDPFLKRYFSNKPNEIYGSCDTCADIGKLIDVDNDVCVDCSEYANGCVNFNNFQDFNLTVDFNEKTQLKRYSMGFWSYIENGFSSNFRVVFENHLAIIIDSVSDTDQDISCFPQEYKKSIENINYNYLKSTLDVSSLDINGTNYKVANNEYNAVKSTVTGNTKTWRFFFCSVNLPLGEFYTNNSSIIKIAPRNSGQDNNYNFYKDNSLSFPPSANSYNLKFLGINSGNTQLFIRSIYLFNIFIPEKVFLNNMFYQDIVASNLPSLILHAVISTLKVDNTRDFVYSTKKSTDTVVNVPTLTVSKTYSSKSTVSYLELCDTTKIADEENITSPFIANVSHKCIDKSASATCTQFCSSDTQAYWCSSNYLSVNSFSCISVKETVDTHIYTSEPNNNSVYYNYNCSYNNMSTCPNPGYTNNQNFSCINEGTDYEKVFYDCVPKSKYDNNSALYFSSSFGFKESTTDLSSITNSEYMIEAWIKVDDSILGDNINNSTITATDKYFYFLLLPHSIYKLNNSWKYFNSSDGEQTIDYSFKTNEWIILYLTVSLLPDGTTNVIKIYDNYNTNSIFEHTSSAASLPLKNLNFCQSIDTTTLECDPTTITSYKWGFAWYKYIRIWNGNYWISPYLYHKLSINLDTSNELFLFGIDMSLNKLTYSTDKYSFNDIKPNSTTEIAFTAEDSNDDNYNKNINYTLDFYNFTEGFTSNSISCSANCNKCLNESHCYECATGFILQEKYCSIGMGYFLETPPLTDFDYELVTSDINIDKGLGSLDKLTISVYFKLMSISFKATDNNQDRVILYLDSNKNQNQVIYRTANYSNNKLLFKLSGIEAFEIDATNLIGKWTLVSISIFRSKDATVSPHMLNIEVNRTRPSLIAGFDELATKITIDAIMLGKDVYAQYYDLRIYAMFMTGTNGFLHSYDLREKYMVKHFILKSSDNNCLNANTELVNNSDITSSDIVCSLEPYRIDIDYNEKCSTNINFMDFDSSSIIKSYTCKDCDNKCYVELPYVHPSILTPKPLDYTCYGFTDNECSCHVLNYSNFLTTTNHCDTFDSLNFSILNEPEIPVKISVNEEMTIEFWGFFYTYLPDTFIGYDIIYNGHMRIAIENGKVLCYPFVDLSDLSKWKDENNIHDEFVEKEWQFVRCSINKNISTEKFYINNKEAVAIKNNEQYNHLQFIENNLVIYKLTEYQSLYKNILLKFKDRSLDPNYGFLFIREFKIFSAYLFHSYNTKHKRFSKDSNEQLTKYMLHYFAFDNTLFDRDNEFGNYYINNSIVIDYIESFTDSSKFIKYEFPTIGKTIFKGYKRVDMNLNYTPILCPEGKFKLDDDRCMVDSEETLEVKCKIQSSIKSCLLCGQEGRYFHYTDSCYSKCPVYYYPDNFVNMCRECHKSCYICDEFSEDKCKYCTYPNFFIPTSNESNKGKCVPDCSVFGKVNYYYFEQNNPIPEYGYPYPSECARPELIILLESSNIDNNALYSYNELNFLEAKIQVTKHLYNHLNQQLLLSENGNIEEPVSNYKTYWKFNKLETRNKNSSALLNNLVDHYLDIDPFTSSTEDLKVDIKDFYFIPGMTYYFELHAVAEISILRINSNYVNTLADTENSINLDDITTKKQEILKFVVNIADVPNNGDIIVNPIAGISDVTDFTIACKGWISEYSSHNKKPLNYRITSRYLGDDLGSIEAFTSLIDSKSLNDEELSDPYYLNEGEVILQDYSENFSIITTFLTSENAYNNSRYEIICRSKDYNSNVNGKKIQILVSKYKNINFENQIKSIFDYNFDKPVDEIDINSIKYLDENILNIENYEAIDRSFLTMIAGKNYEVSGSSTDYIDDLTNKENTIDNNNDNNVSDVQNQSDVSSQESIVDISNSATETNSNSDLCNKEYCNSNGICSHKAKSDGTSYIICECNENFYGVNCQINKNSFILLNKIFNDKIEYIYNYIPEESNITSIDIEKKKSLKIKQILLAIKSSTFSVSLFHNKEESLNLRKLVNKCLNKLSEIHYDNLKEHSILVFKIIQDLQIPFTIHTSIDNTSNNNENTSDNTLRLLNQNNEEYNIKNVQYLEENLKDLVISVLNNKDNNFYKNGIFDVNDNNDFYLQKINKELNYSYYIQTDNVAKKLLSDINVNNESIYIVIINKSIVKNIDDYLKNNISSPNLPLIEIEDCLNNNKDINKNNLAIVIVYYNNSPYNFINNNNKKNIYPNSLLTIELYDIKNKTKINIQNCGKNNYINLYFPINSLNIPNVNLSWNLIKEFRYYGTIDNNYFTDPYYIEPSGKVLKLSLKDRLRAVVIPYKAICNYIDKADYSLKNNGIISTNNNQIDLSLNYYVCKTSHLTDFQVNFDYNLIEDVIYTNNLYYLTKYQLYKYSDNYSNMFLMLFSVIILLLISLSILRYIIINKKTNSFEIFNNNYIQYIIKENLPCYDTKFSMKSIHNKYMSDQIEFYNDYYNDLKDNGGNWNSNNKNIILAEPPVLDKTIMSNNVMNISPIKVKDKNSNNIKTNIIDKNRNDLNNKIKMQSNNLEDVTLATNSINNYKNHKDSITVTPIKVYKKESKFDNNSNKNKIDLEDLNYLDKKDSKSVYESTPDKLRLISNIVKINNSPFNVNNSNNNVNNNYMVKYNNSNNIIGKKIPANSETRLNNQETLTNNLNLNLPILSSTFTYNSYKQELITYSNIPTFTYFTKNIKQRSHILKYFYKKSLLYCSKLSVDILITEFAYISLICSITILMICISNFNVEDDLYEFKDKILYISIIAAIAASIYYSFISNIISISTSNLRRLYNSINYNFSSLDSIKIYNLACSKNFNNNLKSLIIKIINITVIILGFHISFGYFAIYKLQIKVAAICLFLSLFIDLVVFHFMIEAFAALVYKQRKNIFISNIFTVIELLRNIAY